MRIFTLIIISFLILNTSNAGPITRFRSATDGNPQVVPTLTDVWSDVKVDFAWLTSIVNQKNCSHSQRVYLGCVLAVQTFGTALQKNLEVIPVQLLNGQRPFFQTQRLALIEVPSPTIVTPKDAFNYFDLVRKQLVGRFFTLSAAFIKTPNSDFETLLAEIYQKSGRNVKSAVYIETISKFLEVSVDPHTSIRPTKEMEMAKNGSDSSYVGIGIEFTKLTDGLMVKRILNGSGAALAKLDVGDMLLEANDKQLKGLADEKIIELLRGPEGTLVQLTIQRGSSVFKVPVTRKKIVNPIVSSAEVKFNGQSVIYIRLTNFMYAQICEEIENIVKIWDGKNPLGYVLDLRNNPGGNVAIAACVGGIFLGNNKVLSYFEREAILGKSSIQALETKAKVTTARPLSVLINAGSASASELIAAAFRDYNRAYVVGQTSFGKGSYQGCGPMKNNEALTMCSTGGLFFAPSGESNQTVGVAPHISAFVIKEAQEAELFAQREGQLYLFPLQPRKMVNSPSGNWNQLKAPKACLEKMNLDSIYAQASGNAIYFKDYQLLNALAAVECWQK